jgi:hypothetical protein
MRRLVTGLILSILSYLPSHAWDNSKAYLLATAAPGGTMIMQGPVVAIERLHPDFAERLAWTIYAARETGMPDAGVFSAYRPPAFGVGGFRDKFDNLHAYGLAVDVAGIGRSGSETARRFHAIAKANGIACIYGPFNAAEWNHCQATRLRTARGTALRQTITAEHPRDLEVMWQTAENMMAWLKQN